jgi:putative phage-type endonuclease
MKLENTKELAAEQRSAEWHAARQGRITASAVGAILGLSPHTSREDVLRRMVRASLGAPSEFEGNIATDYGVNSEPLALMDYELQTGVTVRPCGLFVGEVHFDLVSFKGAIPFGGRPGGLIGNGTLLEIKCPFGLRNEKEPKFKTAADQPHYYAQMQMQMWLTGANETHFFQWNTYANKPEIVSRQDDWIELHEGQLVQFWIDYQTALADPDEHLEPQRVVIDTPEASRLMAEYDETLEQEERAKERKAELLQAIAALGKGKNALVAGRKVTKTEREGAVSWAKLVKAKLPDLTEADKDAYRGKPSLFWQIR